MSLVWLGGPRVLGPTSSGLAWGPRVLGRAGLVLAWGAKGPGPDRLGFSLGGQGSWAGPAWVWLGGPRVLGRAGLVYNTLNKHDSDEDVNIIPLRNMRVMRMLI